MSGAEVRAALAQEPHARYGPCDGFGPQGSCSECTGLVARKDGAVVTVAGKIVSHGRRDD